jgi:hypothetical protein
MPTTPQIRFPLSRMRRRLYDAYRPIATTLLRLLSVIRREPSPLRDADSYLLFLRDTARKGGANLVFSRQVNKAEFRAREARTEHWQYVQSGDFHYFVSRVLFLNHVLIYSLFAGHQCVENYLKGYLKLCNHPLPRIHDLPKLLYRCREAAPLSHFFIHSDQAWVVAQRYDPFYELARYPVTTVAPQGGWAIFYPFDLQVLDYFVLRMRQLLSIPATTWDIMRDGHFYLENCRRNAPDFYSYLHMGNINFGDSFR